ncbi:unnamed protein product [Bemisia tabaci]|uniref:IFT80/172/WDR35 TPR domain-containing protein n=1 Tax=Bemisia tabaci TaxID=7038 RepID=A0A9P0A6I1_BEMTA|nr:unnamed protein product [Bemisia tabaci]
MQLKHLTSVSPALEAQSSILAVAWSPNNLKLAICNNDRIIYLYDDKGEKKDKFPTKAASSKNGRKSYTIKGLAFSPDSTKLAVAQSDSIIYVYKLGEDWSDKKVICNKFMQQSPVMSLLWLSEGPIIYGLLDGKVKAAHIKANKLQSLYATTSCIVSLASNLRGTGFLSGHADGSIVRYYISDDSSMEAQGRILIHRVAPYVLTWPLGGWILAGGSDHSICVFNGNNGQLEKTFDYSSPQLNEKDFSVACCSPSGQAVIVGGFNRIYMFVWSPNKNVWEEKQVKEIPNLYSVTALAWKRDGSRVACGSVCGAVDIFESVLKKMVWKNKFEMTYVGLSQVLVKPINQDARGVILKSQYGYEIDDVRIVGGDRYLVARTPETLLLGDLERNLLSEVRWPDSDRRERFYFDYSNVCLVFNGGELSLIEYGNNEILSSVRTEFVNPKLVSVRLDERKQLNSSDANKKLAYLLDLKTISVVDLVFGVTIFQFSHDSKIEWLELNETGHKLLFRDKKMKLILLDTRSGEKHTLLHYSTFIQWVPGSDVVVAQSRDNGCVWYNIDTPDRISIFPVKGEITGVVRDSGKIEIISQDGNQQRSYELDKGLVEFGTAVHDSDFGRAILFLEEFSHNNWNSKRLEAEGMWQNLAEIALQLHNLRVAQRCYAALGDIARTHFLRVTLEIADDYAQKNGGDGMDCLEVWARIAILNKQYKTAETIYLEQNQLDKAIKMHQRLHKWDNAVNLATQKGSQELATRLKSNYLEWLMETRQEGKAAELKERDGDIKTALGLYLKAGLPLKALRVIQNNPTLFENEELMKRVLSSLLKHKYFQQAGLFYEALHKTDKALECYRQGRVFHKAVELAKTIAPRDVVVLEEQWGDDLVSNRQFDAAINHYIEAGKTLKALDVAIQDKQWKKAVEIIQVFTDKSSVQKQYALLANHFVAMKDYSQAEEFFSQANMYQQAIDMYVQIRKWDKAYKLGAEHLGKSETCKFLTAEGKRLEEMKELEEAELVYLSIEKPDLAITMYKNYKDYDKMLHLVSQYHPELLATTQIHLAQECAEEGNYTAAERYYTSVNEWKLAVKMYRLVNMWEDAYRVAKTMGGDEAGEQVAFLWAKSLGGESAVRLLNKLNILDACIDHACDSYQFDFALDVANIGAKNKLPDIHYKLAMALEDDGKFSEAEVQFFKANKPKEAVLMYVHNQDWTNAERVAEKCDDSAMEEVLVAQAKQEFEKKNYQNFQTLLLRARKPEIVIKQYQECGMWTEALQICADYLPNMLPKLQREYEEQVSAKVPRDVNSLLLQAKQWEQNGEFKAAIDCYIRIASATREKPIVDRVLNEAATLTITYLCDDEATQTARTLGGRLIEAKLFSKAAQVFLSANMFKEAVDAFILAGEWSNAKKLAYEYEPSLESYINAKYKEHVKQDGGHEQMTELEILMGQGQWAQCLEKAQLAGEETLQKYLALRASALLKEHAALEALDLYVKYGALPYPQNLNIYQRIAIEIISKPGLCTSNFYPQWAKLRNMLYKLVGSFSSGNGNSPILMLNKLFKIAHYYAVRAACMDVASLELIVMKVSIALLRFSDIIPVDKAFYEAGIHAKAVGKETEAVVFLNHFLDICEAIDEQNVELIDFSDLSNTDFPLEVPLPSVPHVSLQDQEEVREWILAVLVNQNVDQVLPCDNRNLYECSLKRSKTDEDTYPACVITGWPVMRNPKLHGGSAAALRSNEIEFQKPGYYANKDDWNKIVLAAKSSSRKSDLSDIIIFITEWCGDPPGFFFH